MSEATFTFRVDEVLKNDFATAAKACDRTGAQLLRDFMRSYVQQQEQTAAHDVWSVSYTHLTLPTILLV